MVHNEFLCLLAIWRINNAIQDSDEAGQSLVKA
jgi:hypothetical protein